MLNMKLNCAMHIIKDVHTCSYCHCSGGSKNKYTRLVVFPTPSGGKGSAIKDKLNIYIYIYIYLFYLADPK